MIGQLSATEAAAIIGVKYTTLHYWLTTGLLTCSVPADGSGSKRGFSMLDILRAQTVVWLRDHGVSLQQIRQIVAALKDKLQLWDPLLTHAARLVVAGDSVHLALDDDTLLEVLSGQLAAAQFVIIPVGKLREQAKARILELIEAA
jgi:DNA-binding transcriptional MerR regulator